MQAHHVAVNEAIIAGVIQDAAEGRPHPPVPLEMLDAINARHAAECANVTQDETIALLRRDGALAADAYQRLTDEQLARTATLMVGDSATSVLHLIEDLALGEIERHGTYIRRDQRITILASAAPWRLCGQGAATVPAGTRTAPCRGTLCAELAGLVEAGSRQEVVR